jgi:SAM-dependent methyltransferase
MTEAMRAAWDAEADRFDDQPDHGLRDERIRAAWWSLLAELVPGPPARVLDLGSGTGSLAVLLAEHGHRVFGVDLAPRMVERAARKAREQSVSVDFRVGDAAEPPVDGLFDVVLVRHVLWAMPDPSAAVDRWLSLLTPAGVLILVEGFWHTGAGIAAADLLELVSSRTRALMWRRLDNEPALWGGPVTDERYLIAARN